MIFPLHRGCPLFVGSIIRGFTVLHVLLLVASSAIMLASFSVILSIKLSICSAQTSRHVCTVISAHVIHNKICVGCMQWVDHHVDELSNPRGRVAIPLHSRFSVAVNENTSLHLDVSFNTDHMIRILSPSLNFCTYCEPERGKAKNSFPTRDKFMGLPQVSLKVDAYWTR